MKRLLVLGCGGHGRVVADTALDCGYDDIAFLDDADPAKYPSGARVLGPLSILDGLTQQWPAAIAALGSGPLRVDLFAKLQSLGFRTPSVVHPSAIISRGARIGAGGFIAAGAIINVGAHVGDAVIVNTGARIDHDCWIGMGAHVAPGVAMSGNVKVGNFAWLGTGSSVRQGVTIGTGALVGVGAAVVSDLEPGFTYVGVPARPLEQRR